MSAAARPLLIVDAYRDPEGGAGSFVRWLGDRPVQIVRVAKGEPMPTDPGDVAGAFITGSAFSWAEGVPWGEPLLAWLRRAATLQVPVLGVCFGHQALGAAFGRGVRKAAVPEAGWKSIEVLAPADDPLLGGLRPSFVSFLSHEDEVVPEPGGLDVLARTDACEVVAVRVPGAPIWGVQFHAEMGLDEARSLLAFRARRHPELQLNVDEAFRRAAEAHDVAPVLFERFLQVVDSR